MPSELSEHHQPKTRSWIAKFRDTFRGLRFAVQEQSFRIHLVMATLVLIVTGVLGATTTEWLFLATAISAVMVTEILNTAIERIARAITDEENPLIGQALDLASAAVLTASIFAVTVGILILGPKLWAG
jgi:diacylglycerol kinase